jgi:membrane protein DedA with SNARE-associated domain
VLVFALLLLLLMRTGQLPPQDKLLERIGTLARSPYAIWLTAIAAVESTVAINVYFPGALVILASMAATKGQLDLTLRLFVYIVVGQIAGYLISYTIGYYVRSREPPPPSSELNGTTAWSVAPLILSTYWHPHSAALTSYNLGTQGLAPLRFVAIASLIAVFWGAVWTILCLNGLSNMISETPWDFIFLAYVCCWIAWILFRETRREA